MTYLHIEESAHRRVERQRDEARQLVARLLYLSDEARRWSIFRACPFCEAVTGHTADCPAKSAVEEWFPSEKVGGVE